MSTLPTASSSRLPDAAALCTLLDGLKLKHDPLIRRFTRRSRTPEFIQLLSQRERVVESSGDVCQMGLCYFHVGLFKLYWKESIGAAHRFRAAGRFWRITPLPAVVCLAALAEGVAWHQRGDLEAALLACTQAERQAKRLARALNHPDPTEKSIQLRKYLQKLQMVLKQSQEALRQALDDDNRIDVAPPSVNL